MSSRIALHSLRAAFATGAGERAVWQSVAGEGVVIPTWGLLGPETRASERRTRTLGLGAPVRLFNDRAVPGLGGAWFGKQLFLPTWGVVVAERLRGGERGRNPGRLSGAQPERMEQ